MKGPDPDMEIQMLELTLQEQLDGGVQEPGVVESFLSRLQELRLISASGQHQTNVGRDKEYVHGQSELAIEDLKVVLTASQNWSLIKSL